MQLKVDLQVAPSAALSKAAPSTFSKVVDTAQKVGKTAVNLATSPLAAYFGLSTAVIAYGTDSSLLKSAGVNGFAHVVGLSAATIYGNYLRSRQRAPIEIPVKIESFVVEITKDTYKKEVLESKLPVILDAYADWCPPCKGMTPILSELSNEMKGKVKFVKFNTDTQPELAKLLKVEALPMLIFFKGGKIVGKEWGFAPKSQLLSKSIQLFF